MKYKYDIALSYKSEIQEKVTRIADYLKSDGWDVFFAPYRQQEMLSEDVHTTLYDVYKNKSFLKVLFITDSYLVSEWTQLEIRMALNSTEEERGRLLIVNFTDKLQLDGKLKNLLYLDGREKTEDEIACIVTERMKKFFSGDSSDVEKIEKTGKKDNGYTNITINNGIMAGDNAHFGNVQF